jgi:hypothetical protein
MALAALDFGVRGEKIAATAQVIGDSQALRLQP